MFRIAFSAIILISLFPLLFQSSIQRTVAKGVVNTCPIVQPSTCLLLPLSKQTCLLKPSLTPSLIQYQKSYSQSYHSNMASAQENQASHPTIPPVADRIAHQHIYHGKEMPTDYYHWLKNQKDEKPKEIIDYLTVCECSALLDDSYLCMYVQPLTTITILDPE